ncbi:MAG: transcription elongation factor GreA [Candidatus Peribacteria bacterium]|nr:transcription elongation factor GreA [Candidatus Peribacteria bacterium]
MGGLERGVECGDLIPGEVIDFPLFSLLNIFAFYLAIYARFFTISQLSPVFSMADDILSDEDLGSGSAGGFGDDDHTLVTKEGLKKLRDELEHLKKVRRSEVAQRLKEAISYGDLSENSEYEEAKNEQAFVEGRIMELEQKIKNAKIISDKKTEKGGKTIDIGSTITIQNVTDNDEAEEYTIVGSTEADPLEKKISNESPIGRSMLGHVKGETVEVQTPGGAFEYEILKVS